MKILHLDSTHPYLYKKLENLGFTNKFDFESSKDQIEIKISSYHGIIIRSRIPIDKSLINKATNLKFIARVGSGTENIDIKHAEKKKNKYYFFTRGQFKRSWGTCIWNVAFYD